MARGRMISKAISLDEKVDALSNDTARLLFTWLITHLDCEGRMHGDAQTVKSIVFPRRSMDVRTMQKYLDELVKSGLIQRYVNGGITYIYFPNFKKHQVGLNKSKELPSQIPPSPQQKVDVDAMLQQQRADVDAMLQLNGKAQRELNVDSTLAQQELPSQIPASKTENLRKDDGNSPAQVKVKIKDKEETKEESISSLSIEDVFEVYRKEVMESPDEISEDMENQLVLATERFTVPWVIDAIREGVRRKRKDWQYITGILKNWKRYGKDADFPSNKGLSGKQDPDKYIKGPYGHMVQR